MGLLFRTCQPRPRLAPTICSHRALRVASRGRARLRTCARVRDQTACGWAGWRPSLLGKSLTLLGRWCGQVSAELTFQGLSKGCRCVSHGCAGFSSTWRRVVVEFSTQPPEPELARTEHLTRRLADRALRCQLMPVNARRCCERSLSVGKIDHGPMNEEHLALRQRRS